MILQALYAYYNLLLEQEGDSMPREGYSSAGVSFEIHLEADGRIVEILPYVNDKGKIQKRSYNVPEQGKRSVNILSYFLCDKPEYLFGAAIGQRAACREAMQRLWREVLTHVIGNDASPEIAALTRFVDWEEPELAEQLDRLLSEEQREVLLGGGLCVLKYAPTGRFLHDYRPVQQAWERYLLQMQPENMQAGELQTCLVSGERVPMGEIARLHPSIKNVVGAQSSGAAIVSFNKDSFISYGKEQSYNAPTSKKAADAYGYVLNRLLADSRHRVRMNDMTVVFWAESRLDHEQMFLASLMQEEAVDDAGQDGMQPDPESVRERVKSAVARVRGGQEFRDTFSDLNPETTFYVLGLSPNAARLSIRFFHKGTLGEIGERVWQHYKDLAIVGLERTPTIRQLLRELAVGHEWDKIPPNMEGQMFRSILQGLPYSQAIFAQLISRIRADSDEPRKGGYKIGSLRAAMLKAYLLRRYRSVKNRAMEGEVTVEENKQSSSVAYNLGRLFACLEKTQMSALGREINATIRDRFWGAASASPATVFPRLLHLAQHHVSKDEKWGGYNNDLIQKVIATLPERLPRRLTLEEQGMFAIGYYHKRESFYSKPSTDTQQNDADADAEKAAE